MDDAVPTPQLLVWYLADHSVRSFTSTDYTLSSLNPCWSFYNFTIPGRLFSSVQAYASLAAGASTVLTTRVAGAGLNYGAQVVLARIVGADQYGAYSFAMALVALLCTFSGGGLPQAVVRFVPAHYSKRRSGLLKGVTERSEQVVLVFSSTAAILGAGLVAGVETSWTVSYLLRRACIRSTVRPSPTRDRTLRCAPAGALGVRGSASTAPPLHDHRRTSAGILVRSPYYGHNSCFACRSSSGSYLASTALDVSAPPARCLSQRYSQARYGSLGSHCTSDAFHHWLPALARPNGPAHDWLFYVGCRVRGDLQGCYQNGVPGLVSALCCERGCRAPFRRTECE